MSTTIKQSYAGVGWAIARFRYDSNTGREIGDVELRLIRLDRKPLSWTAYFVDPSDIDAPGEQFRSGRGSTTPFILYQTKAEALAEHYRSSQWDLESAAKDSAAAFQRFETIDKLMQKHRVGVWTVLDLLAQEEAEDKERIEGYWARLDSGEEKED